MKAANAALVVGLMLCARGVWADDPPECDGIEAVPSECFPNVMCQEFEPYWDYRRAVVRIEGPDLEATGVLVNNGGCWSGDGGTPDCGRPYLLTALHVASGTMGHDMSPGEVHAIQEETDFIFGFEALDCAGTFVTAEVAVSGSSVIARAVDEDLLLLYLDSAPPPEAGAYYVGWGSANYSPAVCISHPCGGPKRIALVEQDAIEAYKAVTRDVLMIEQWEVGAVIDASSGAPLLSPMNGHLMAIYTNTLGASSKNCIYPDEFAQDLFTAYTSIEQFWPNELTHGRAYVNSYDSNPYAQSPDVEVNDKYYGPGKHVKLKGKHAVYLVPRFHADEGSHIIVEVSP